MNIVVLCGGLSTERDVSITSGIMVANALKERHNVVLLDVFMGYEEETCDIEKLFEQGYNFSTDLGVKKDIPDIEKVKSMRKYKSSSFLGRFVEDICKYADITFLALHGEDGENGKLQAMFDLMGIKYTGSGYLGSAVAMNKGITKSVLLSKNLSTPKGNLYSKNDDFSMWKTYPCVVKPNNGGSSVGVAIVEEEKDFKNAMENAFKYEDEVLVEQFISGREFSIGVLDGKALPIIEIIPNDGFYDYLNKYQSGKTQEICPAILSKEETKALQEETEKVYKALGLQSYGRIDFLQDKDGQFYCLEANTLPGMTPTSLLPQEAKEIGLEYVDLCEKIIEISLKKYI